MPRKNLRLLNGKPLVVYPISTAQACQLITRTIVSTDDEEIAETARRYGAEVPFKRPADLAADDTPDLPVFQHALRWLCEREGYVPDLVVHLRATSPLREAARVDEAIRIMLEHPDADALRSVSQAVHTPYKMWRIVDGLLKPLITLDGAAESYNWPRQRLPEVFWHNGYVDIIRPDVILKEERMTGKHILPFVIEHACIDIDTEEDLRRAELELTAGTVNGPKHEH